MLPNVQACKHSTMQDTQFIVQALHKNPYLAQALVLHT